MKEGLEKFSARLKEVRIKKGIKQTDMALFFNCPVRKYQRIENGEVNVYILTLIKLADYFDVTTDYLLGRSDEGGPDSKEKPPEKSDGKNST